MSTGSKSTPEALKPAVLGGPKTREEFLVFSKPHFGEEEEQEVITALRSGWVGTGPRAAQFEKEFAAYKGAPHAIAMNSCTAALHVAFKCLDLQPGDEVLVPALTFGATANAVVHAGGTPVFVDVEDQTLAMSAVLAERALSPRTKGVVIVHFAGRLARDIEKIAALCERKGIPLIEDCAHAIETRKGGRHAGTFGQAGCFSFYANKNVSTAEGGMLITADGKLADRARKLSLHGMSKDAHKRFSEAGYSHYDFEEFGFKYNMPDIAAALGLHQLRRVEENYGLRQRLWNHYATGLQKLNLPLELPAPLPGGDETHALHLFQIRVKASLRDKMLGAYAPEGIGVGVHYRALTDLKIYQRFITAAHKELQAGYAVATRFGEETISLPLGTAMTETDATHAMIATAKLLTYFTKAPL